MDDMTVNKREDGRIEWICYHGIGHTVFSPIKGKYAFVHGCDGCCSDKDCKQAKKRFSKL